MSDWLLEMYIAQSITKQVWVTLNEVGGLIFFPICYSTNYLNDRIRKCPERIKDNVLKENRIEAKPYITIPTLQNLVLHDNETFLDKMLFNILQNSVNKTKQNLAME